MRDRKDNCLLQIFLLAVFMTGMALRGTAAPDTKKGDEDITRGEVGRFDWFLDKHPSVGKDLKKNPSLVNNKDYLEDHPELREFLKTHPKIREELKENPTAFMKREADLEKSGGDITRRELRNFDRFLDKHPEIAKDLRRNPSLVNSPDYLEDHPALRKFLSTHPGVREELKENPALFMKREARFERRGGDITRTELRSFDRYLDRHPEVAKQLMKDPSLVNNKEYLEKHPGLVKFLRAHSRVREELKENPRAFMNRERRFERYERMQARRKKG